jgi:hypothetical protein
MRRKGWTAGGAGEGGKVGRAGILKEEGREKGRKRAAVRRAEGEKEEGGKDSREV